MSKPFDSNSFFDHLYGLAPDDSGSSLLDMIFPSGERPVLGLSGSRPTRLLGGNSFTRSARAALPAPPRYPLAAPQSRLEAAAAGLGRRPVLPPPRVQLSSLQEELRVEVKKIFRENWTERDGQVVPEPTAIGLGNDAVKLDATVLYADMNGSTQLVDQHPPRFAAEVYKTYLSSAAKIIKSEGGVITAYDGDRVMGIFIGESKNTSAVKAALKINWVVDKLINPAISEQYPSKSYRMRHVVGVDTSSIFASRIGVRNDNDIVWVGRAANYAAKLTTLNGYPVYITVAVHDNMHDSVKFGGTPQRSMWEQRSWTAMNNMMIYRSNWTWTV